MFVLVVQKCMPACVQVFPMKNILYICAGVIYASLGFLRVCQLQMCWGQSRAALPGPDVSRCGLQCHACMLPRLSLDPATGRRVEHISRYSGCLRRTIDVN